MGFLDETGLARFLDKIKSHYVASAEYCADCNAALTPGRYYIDSSTANSPFSAAGIMIVESKGGASDIALQTVVKTPSTDSECLVYGRKIVKSSGSFSSATVWGLQNYVPASKHPLFRLGDGRPVLSPRVGKLMPCQTTSTYELVRLYHHRDVTRDAAGETYGFIARFSGSTAPTSSTANPSHIVFGESCGGITSKMFILGGYWSCSSNVVYTDSTEETVYGVILKAGDTYHNKTVASVTYSRYLSASSPWFSFEEDNLATIGKADQRWSTVYAGTGSINTSDERLKTSIESVPDAVLDAWGDVDWVQYKFNDAIEKKGEGARIHSGMIAQRIDAVLKAHGLDASRYGLFCHDVWEADETRPAGDRYSLRYEEALAMEAAYQRRRADRLEARIAALEARLNG